MSIEFITPFEQAAVPPSFETTLLRHMTGRMSMRSAGGRFLLIPGPSAVPARILGAMSRQRIDQEGPEFDVIGQRALQGLKTVFRTDE